MTVSLYRTLGTTLHTICADYDCVWWLSLLYQVLWIDQFEVLPCPTRSMTRTDAEREVAKLLHFEEVILRLRLYLDVYSAWMISKIGIISKRQLLCFEFCGGLPSSVCFAWRLQGLSVCLFCLTSARPERVLLYQLIALLVLIYCVWCCRSVSHFERAWSARQPDIGLKSIFCATLLRKYRLHPGGVVKTVYNFGWIRTWNE